jgi:hypothetical protein
MAFSDIKGTIPGLLAGADLSAAQFRVVKLASTAGEVVLATANTDNAVGILQNNPTAGEAAEVAYLGISKAIASADVTAGEFVTANSTGQVTNINSTAGSTIVGQALEASAVAGSIISVRLGVGVQ